MKLSIVKMEAKKLKKDKGIKHTLALDLVAKSYGFKHYYHLLTTLGLTDLPKDYYEKFSDSPTTF